MSDERSIVYFDEEQGQFIVSRPKVMEVLGAMIDGQFQRFRSLSGKSIADVSVGALTGLGVGVAFGGVPGLVAGLVLLAKVCKELTE